MLDVAYTATKAQLGARNRMSVLLFHEDSTTAVRIILVWIYWPGVPQHCRQKCRGTSDTLFQFPIVSWWNQPVVLRTNISPGQNLNQYSINCLNDVGIVNIVDKEFRDWRFLSNILCLLEYTHHTATIGPSKCCRSSIRFLFPPS